MSNRLRKHAKRHESGGLDEIDLANLAGTLGDAQATQFLLLDGTRKMTGKFDALNAIFDLGDSSLEFDELTFIGVKYPQLNPLTDTSANWMFIKSGLYLYEPTTNNPSITLYRSVAGAPSTTKSGSLVYSLSAAVGLKFFTTGEGAITFESVDNTVKVDSDLLMQDNKYVKVGKVAALPAAGAAYRRMIVAVEGVSLPPPLATPDVVSICLKDGVGAGGGFNWYTIATGLP